MYNEFINEIISTRGQWNNELRNNYCERHHILPKCLGGLPKSLNWQHHENIIWLTAKEHFIAHKLLAEENPTNYQIVSAFKRMCYSKHNSLFVTEENIDFIKATWSKLHSEHLTGKKHKEHKIKNKLEYSLQKSVQCIGEGNPMFGKGYKIAGGQNGKATKVYYFKNSTFLCRKELVKYLKTLDCKISISTIRKFEQGSERVKREHKILENLKWNYKNENTIN